MKHKRRRRGGDVAPKKPGLAPGTLIADPDAPHPRIELIAYDAAHVERRLLSDLRELPDLFGRWTVLWLNVDGLGDTAVLERLGEIFGLHRLALEDVLHLSQRPKIEEYKTADYIVMRMAVQVGSAETEQLSLFLGSNFLITFQEKAGDCFDPVRERIKNGTGRLRSSGADYLAYSLLDAAADHYFPLVEHCEERLQALEEEILTRYDKNANRRIHELNLEMITLRRAILPLRDVMRTLMREPNPRIREETRLYLRDCHDHIVQITELLDHARETANGLMGLHVSMISSRMNEVMKVLTMIATIFIPLSFIAGLYGMNFNTSKSPFNMPELNWIYGYPFALSLMGTVAIGLLIFFKRKGWLGGDEPKKKDVNKGRDG